MSLGWAEKVWKAKRDTGSTDRPLGGPRGFPSRLTPEIRQRLTEQIGKQPDATLEEWREWLDKQEDVRISPQRLSAVILEMGLQVKKSLHASEQDSVEGIRRREQWREETKNLDASAMVFIDESGVTTDMTRLYGRARPGQRIHEGTPGGQWSTVTMLRPPDLNELNLTRV